MITAVYSYKWRVFFFLVGMRVVLFLVCIKNSTISSKNDHCCILVQVACFFLGGWDLAFFFLFIVPTYLVCVASFRVLYYLVSYCLLVRVSRVKSTAQQQSAFTLENLVPYCRSVRHVPTLKMRVVLFLVCIKNSTVSSTHVHCCILVHVSIYIFFLWVGILPFIVRTYLVCVASSRVLYC